MKAQLSNSLGSHLSRHSHMISKVSLQQGDHCYSLRQLVVLMLRLIGVFYCHGDTLCDISSHYGRYGQGDAVIEKNEMMS